MSKKKKKPSLADIAQAAGVSTSTVSRALKENPQIPIETCKKIQKVAAQLGYQANPYVGAFMAHVRSSKEASYKANVLFIDIASDPKGWKTSKVLRGMHQGAKRQARALGYSLDFFHFDPAKNDAARIVRTLKNRNIAGILFAPSSRFYSHLPTFRAFQEFPCVTLGMKLQGASPAFAMNDQFHSAQLGHRKLRELGYKRVGLVSLSTQEKLLDHRFSSGFESLKVADGVSRIIPVYLTEQESQRYQKFVEWFEKHKPDAILSVESQGINWLKKMGKRIPQDVGYANFQASEDDSSIAGICQNDELIGVSAMNLLYGFISRHEMGVPQYDQGILVRGYWVNGDSVRKK